MLLEFERLVNVMLHHEPLKMSREKKALKLHEQFACASKEKLISLVRGSKAFNKFLDLIWDVCDSCFVCLRFRKPPL